MPSVCVWRELRRVSKDQVEHLRRDGEAATWGAWASCHRHGEAMQASWRGFMEAMGGHCVGRGKWQLGMARRDVEPGQVNQYGEEITVGRTVGLRTRQGRWLISRRIAWTPVAQESETYDPDSCTDADPGRSLAVGEARAPLARAWTGFNNCRGRGTGALRRAALGRGRHEKEDWEPGSTFRTDAEWRAIGPSNTPFLQTVTPEED